MTQSWMQNRGGSLKLSHVRGQALAQSLHVPPEDSQTSCSSETGGAGQSEVATHSPSLLSTVPPGQTQPTTQTWEQNNGGLLKLSHVRGQALAQKLHAPPEDSQICCSPGTGGEGDGTCGREPDE